MSIVTSSMPSAMPAMKRHRSAPKPLDWKARIRVATEYPTSDQTKMARRPSRSAAEPKMMAPTNRPAKVANTKVPVPATPNFASPPKMPSDCGVNSPDPPIPGIT